MTGAGTITIAQQLRYENGEFCPTPKNPSPCWWVAAEDVITAAQSEFESLHTNSGRIELTPLIQPVILIVNLGQFDTSQGISILCGVLLMGPASRAVSRRNIICQLYKYGGITAKHGANEILAETVFEKVVSSGSGRGRVSSAGGLRLSAEWCQ
ncbi:hypothetical protein BDN67DRAFT_984215 [Paxillus ammoniavirescens]|nr:hypothetical protein BDN67DRAFT_984215 [Paxillus ammoniavirescens]